MGALARLLVMLYMLLAFACESVTGPEHAIILVESPAADLVLVMLNGRDVLPDPPLRMGTRLRLEVEPGCHSVYGLTVLGGAGTVEVCPTAREPIKVVFE